MTPEQQTAQLQELVEVLRDIQGQLLQLNGNLTNLSNSLSARLDRIQMAISSRK